MAGPITSLAVDLAALADIDEPVQHAMGMLGKTAALDNASRDLGTDRRFSNLRGGRAAALSAGYDLGNPVIVNLRPEGLWLLAQDGRKRSGTIRPKPARSRRRRQPRGRPALQINGRWVATSRYRPSRGLNTIDDTVDDINRQIDDTVADAVVKKV